MPKEVVVGKLCLRRRLDKLARRVPETLRQMLAQQVERLSGEEQQIMVGRLREAGTYAQCAYDLACTYGERPAEACILQLRGDFEAQNTCQDVAKAEVYYQQALALASLLGKRPLCGHYHQSLGSLYRQIGRIGDARAELSPALALYCDMGVAVGSAQVKAALAQLDRSASAER